jgi:hypothetical protein
MKSAQLLLFAVLPTFVSPAPVSAQVLGNVPQGWTIHGTDPIEIVYGGRLVTRYHAGYEEGRPYFYPIMGPSGENMTRHWPMNDTFKDEETDHPFHRGMWFGLGDVNGYDFWRSPDKKPAEGDKEKRYGLIRHKGMNGVLIKGPTITIKTKSDWLDAENPEKRICSDEREFTLFFREDGSLALDVTLNLVADAGDVTIGDGEEAAFAIRTIPTLQLKGKVGKGHILTSEGLADAEAWGKRAAWVDYYGPDRAGNPVGIAIFDHPTNFRHPTWWHARDYGLFAANPFGQGKFEEGAAENAGEYVIPNGELLTFRYRIIFHEGDPETAAIAKAFEAFGSK